MFSTRELGSGEACVINICTSGSFMMLWQKGISSVSMCVVHVFVGVDCSQQELRTACMENPEMTWAALYPLVCGKLVIFLMIMWKSFVSEHTRTQVVCKCSAECVVAFVTSVCGRCVTLSVSSPKKELSLSVLSCRVRSISWIVLCLCCPFMPLWYFYVSL